MNWLFVIDKEQSYPISTCEEWLLIKQKFGYYGNQFAGENTNIKSFDSMKNKLKISTMIGSNTVWCILLLLFGYFDLVLDH